MNKRIFIASLAAMMVFASGCTTTGTGTGGLAMLAGVLLLAHITFCLPFVAGYVAAREFPALFSLPDGVNPTLFALFLAIAMSISALPVIVKADSQTVTVYLREKVLATHTRCWEKRQRIELPAHREAARKQRPQEWQAVEVSRFLSFGPEAQVFLEPGNALLHGVQGGDALRYQHDLVGFEGFGDIVGGPAANSFNRRVDGGIGGDDHDFQPGAGGQQKGDQVHPALRSQPQVDERQIEDLQRRFLLRIFEAADGGDAVPPGLQTDGQGLADAGFVVDDQDVQWSRFLARGLGHGCHPAAG